MSTWEYGDRPTRVAPYVGSYSRLEQTSNVNEISARKNSPKLVRMLMEEFKLKWVFEVQSMRLLNPYNHQVNWEKVNERVEQRNQFSIIDSPNG